VSDPILQNIFDEIETNRLKLASSSTQGNQNLPTAASGYLESRGILSPTESALMEQGIDTAGFTDTSLKSDTELDMEQAGILNQGAPTSVRALISFGQVSDPDLQKKNVLYHLNNYYKEQGLITDDYDFGLRVGPQSGRLEYKDPSNQGKYNVLDPVGGLDLITGDLADLAGDIPTILAEIGAATGVTFIPGIGQTGVAQIGAASLAALGTEILRLKVARSTGALSPDVTDDDILNTALNTAKWSALGGTGGLLLYKFGRPFLSKLGLVPQGLRFDLDEESFLKAYDSYTKSGAKQSAKEIGVVPTSAQVAKIASEDPTLTALEKTQMASLSGKLAREEKLVATSPDLETGAAITDPSLMAQILAKEKFEKAAGEGVDVGTEITEETLLKLGQGVQKKTVQNAEGLKFELEKYTDQKLIDVEKGLDDLVNLPPNVADASTIGKTAQDAIQESYSNTQKNFDKEYEDLYKAWENKTGISIDSTIVGKGGIKPTELANEVVKLKRTFKDRAFVNNEERALIDKIYDTFILSEKGSAIKVKDISLRTLNENLRDLRRLERGAYLKSLSGQDSPYPETLSKMVDALEKARNRVISRKNAPPEMVEKLKVLDDGFADFAKKFRNAKISSIAKLRNARNPEAAFNILFKPDRTGKTAVLEIANELKANPKNADLVEYIGDTVRKKWLDTVVKRNKDGQIISINQAAHNKFLDDYKSVFDEYLSPASKAALDSGSVREFADQVVKVQSEKKAIYNLIEKDLRLSGGQLDKPETLFDLVWKQDEISPFSKAFPIIKENTELLKTFKALVYRDMLDPLQQRVIPKGNVMVPNLELLVPYVQKNKNKLQQTFGDQYVANLEKVLTALKPALTDVSPQQARQPTDLLTTFARSVVGVFTRPGRVLTFINKFRGRAREDALVQGLIDPDKLAAMAKASKLSPGHSAAIQTLGRIYFGGDRSAPFDEDMNVPKPSSAEEILKELQQR
tara:strand:+ start:929 stop:3850 length:2922 start_codon:yes stop_codon:yes gene_type:complete